MTELKKWWQTVQISWSKAMAYKLNFLLIIIGPAIVFFFIQYSLWTSIFHINGGAAIKGYQLQDMLMYQVWVLVIGLIAKGHNSMNLSEDIRLGRISAYLIYPFEFWQFHTANFIGFQIIQFVVAIVTLIALRVVGIMPSLDIVLVMKGFAYCTVVGFVWFAIQYIAGLMAFWLEETWMVRVLLSLVVSFLSGAMIPLEIFPEWLAKLLHYSPFPYLTYVPAKIFMGTYTGSLLGAVSVLGFWLVGLSLLATLLWRKGLRLYTAAGM
jgi:ABC-2 type transport system permease protein